MPISAKPRKYPGRVRVVHRDDARDHLWRQSFGASSRDGCERPVPIYAIGLPSILDRDQRKLPVEFEARCRKCAGCLAHRRRLWTARAVDEIAASDRTWFGTLTVRAEERVKLGWKAEAKRLRPGGEVLGDLTAPELFAILANELGKEVTRFLKRVRKECGAYRYLLVFEAHKDGFPHVHLLMHEHGSAIRKATLERQWKFGFSHWRLVDREPKAAVYVCKYLAKDALTRVRASLHYGQRTKVERFTERLEDATRSLYEGADGDRLSNEGSEATGKEGPPAGG